MKEIIYAYQKLLISGRELESKDWQSTKAPQPMIGIFDLDIISTEYDFQEDQPWVDRHFEERLAGSVNPGETYKIWPYYKGKKLDSDREFRKTGKFSHTYMERYNPHPGSWWSVLLKMKGNPFTRQAYLSVWWKEDQRINVGRVPCTLGYWFWVENNKLNMKYTIRSCDAVRHFRNDLALSWKLLERFATELELDIGYMKTWIGSFHCFQTDLYAIKKFISKNKDFVRIYNK